MQISRKIWSPNFGERKNGARAEYVILHFTAMEDPEATAIRLCSPEFEVSAHYLLCENGEIWQLVKEEHRAWHAGLSYWAGEGDMNSRSIGVEIINNGARPFSEAQYEVLIPMLRDICTRHQIPPSNVLGHADIAVGRKFDPGPWFDWNMLDEAGVSAPPKAKIHSEEFLKLAESAGYDPRAPLDELLTVIRMRHGATPFFGALRASDLHLLR